MPSFRRHFRNLLVTGHRNNRLVVDDSSRKKIFDSLEDVIKIMCAYADRRGEIVRIITGFSDGTDENAAIIAEKHKIPLHVVAPTCPKSIHSAFNFAERIALVAEESIDISPDAWVAASDEAKLSFADVLIVIWDGNPPQGHAGGSIRHLIEALRRYSPVIWIDARQGHAGMVRVVDPKRLDAPTLAMLDADEKNVNIIQKQFDLLSGDISLGIKLCLDVFWSSDGLNKFEKVLTQNNVDPKESVTYSGIVHSSLLWTIGKWKIKNIGRITPYRGHEDFVGSCIMPPMIWSWFDCFDRVSVHAANKHRDSIVLINMFSSMAVLGAVAGTIDWLEITSMFWALFELATLLGILMLVLNNRRKPMKNHKIWLELRQAAESLRLSALLYTALATLPSLHRGIWQHKKNGISLVKPYYWFVVQLLREVGVPPLSGSHCVAGVKSNLLGGMNALIDSQVKFHKDTHKRLHQTHSRLEMLIRFVFFIVLTSVLFHIFALGVHVMDAQELHVPVLFLDFGEWIHDQHWMLLITAFFPALAGALHGIMSKLEIQRISESSNNISLRLQAIKIAANDRKDDFMALRALAIETARTMHEENEAWAELMQSQDLEIPA